MNKVIIVGNIGADPEVKRLEGGTSVLNFQLASTRNFTDPSGDPKEETTWHRCTAWAMNAENIALYVKNGHKLLIEGRLQERTYTQEHQNADSKGNPTGDKVTVTHYATEIIVDRFELLTSKAQGEAILVARNARQAEQSESESESQTAEKELVTA